MLGPGRAAQAALPLPTCLPASSPNPCAAPPELPCPACLLSPWSALQRAAFERARVMRPQHAVRQHQHPLACRAAPATVAQVAVALQPVFERRPEMLAVFGLMCEPERQASWLATCHALRG